MILDQISFAYQKDNLILKMLNLRFQSGELCGIIGPNGSGKSTVIKLLSAEISPIQGQVFLGRQDIRSMHERTLARHVAVVPQHATMVFDFSVLDVVLMGRHPYRKWFGGSENEDLAICHACMEQTGISHLANRAVTTLSGGQWQRVIIARALAQQTDILLLDEPIASLDIKYQVRVLSLMRHLTKVKGMTIICVLHDLNLAAQYCHHLILLQKGQLLCEGTAQDVLTPKRLQEAYGITVDSFSSPIGDSQVILPRYFNPWPSL